MHRIIIVILILLIGCDFKPKSFNGRMDEIRKEFARTGDSLNRKTILWENLKKSFYRLADSNSAVAINEIDKNINNNKSLDRFQISELYFIKGDIYYKIDSFQLSLDAFSNCLVRGAPKYLAAEAGSYIGLKRYHEAFADLTDAASINWDYQWNLGNYYEIVGKKDSAIFFYRQLYSRDTKIYKRCNDRINELSDPNEKLYTKLIFTDRSPTPILLFGGVKK